MTTPEELTPHPYKHDAWYMLGYLRQHIINHGAINTTDWLEALNASRISQAEEQEARRVAEELNLPTPTFILEEPLRPTPSMREALKVDIARARRIISKREDDDLIYGPGEEENDEADEAFDEREEG